MRVHFWGTRGSLPVSPSAAVISAKLAKALVAAGGRRFIDECDAQAFVEGELDFATGQGYGGASSCVEIADTGNAFFICDMGSGLREFGLDAAVRAAAGHPRRYNFFLSHLHWDHIMGFPFFLGGFDGDAIITIYSGHADAELALRRQQEEISFPVPFDYLRANFQFVTMEPGKAYEVDGLSVTTILQHHSHDSYGFRFSNGQSTIVYSTDSEHPAGDMASEHLFESFFGNADLVICDTMYSLVETVTMKEDWGHSSNLVAVDLCHAAGAKRLALFHHEPTYSDDDIQRMHGETIRYEAINREGKLPLEVICAYDGLALAL